jgi:hypothetical protein
MINRVIRRVIISNGKFHALSLLIRYFLSVDQSSHIYEYFIVKKIEVTSAQPGMRFLGTAATKPAAASIPKDVVVPELYDTLEWTLSSPPPLHQFTEQPVSL